MDEYDHILDGVSFWKRLKLIARAIRYLFFSKYKANMYYFYTRRPFKQDCYLCHKEHVVHRMEDPGALLNSCDECFADPSITEEEEQAARAEWMMNVIHAR